MYGEADETEQFDALVGVRKRVQLFESNTSARRRSILFSMAIATGVLGAIATTVVLLTVQHLPTILLMSVLSACAFVFSGFLFAGRFDSLTADDELLWQLFES